MQVVPIESRSVTALNNQIREGVIRAVRILEGEPGPDNFALKLVNIQGDFFSPRHRHNFDQVRLQLEGSFDYDRDGCFTPGAIGYFPEGTRYGPQTSSGNTWNLLLQFGGASGSGYTAESEEEHAAAALREKGKFEKGVYTYFNSDGTKVNQDAYEAVWEHIHGRALVYPKERYERPVFMNSTQRSTWGGQQNDGRVFRVRNQTGFFQGQCQCQTGSGREQFLLCAVRHG